MKTFLSIVCALLLSFRLSAQINIDYDHAIDFRQYKTFSFEPGSVIAAKGSAEMDTALLNRNVKEALTKELMAKGLSPSESGDADLTITYMAGAKEKKQIENYLTSPAFGFGYGYGRFYGAGGWWGPGWNNWWVNRYEEGTLILDMYDTHKKELVWRAYAVSPINNYNDRKFVDREVTKSLKRFPPKEKAK